MTAHLQHLMTITEKQQETAHLQQRQPAAPQVGVRFPHVLEPPRVLLGRHLGKVNPGEAALVVGDGAAPVARVDAQLLAGACVACARGGEGRGVIEIEPQCES